MILLSRPKKLRKVCCEPDFERFGPTVDCRGEIVLMTLEEYEVIRLIDHRNLDQIEASEQMGVARSTIQRIYKEAREKIADSIVNGKSLKIQGGQYVLCERKKQMKDCPDCPSQIRGRKRGEK
jgi:uncharacterized protein